MLTKIGIILLFLSLTNCGPAAYGICQTGCNALYEKCCLAAGVTAGTFTLGVGTPVAVVGCTIGQGLCMAACVAAGAGPTPWSRFWKIDYFSLF